MAVYTHCCRAQPLRQLGFLVTLSDCKLTRGSSLKLKSHSCSTRDANFSNCVVYIWNELPSYSRYFQKTIRHV